MILGLLITPHARCGAVESTLGIGDFSADSVFFSLAKTAVFNRLKVLEFFFASLELRR